MEAIIWKKSKTLLKSKFRLYLFILFPVVYWLMLIARGVEYNLIIGYFPLSCAVFSHMIHWQVEDIIYSEALMVTRLSIKRYWRISYLFSSILGYGYACLVLLILTFIRINMYETHVSLSAVVQLMVSFFLAVAITALNTIQYADFSKFKQLFGSVFGLLQLAIPGTFLMYWFAYPEGMFTSICILLASLILICLGEYMVSKSKSEVLLKNLKKMVDGYTANMLDE